MDENSPAQAKTKGRPAAVDATPKALKAAQKILINQGFARLTIEAVAAKTGLGKPTLYRRWPNASALAMQALLTMAKPIPNPSGPIEAALTAQLAALVAAFATPWGAQVVQVLAAAALSSEPGSEQGRAFADSLFAAPRSAGRTALQAAIQNGEIAAPFALEALLDMLYAPILTHLLLGQPAPDAVSLVKTALAACAVGHAAKPRTQPRTTAPQAPAKDPPRQASLF